MRCLYSVKIYVKLYTFVGFEVHSTWFYVIDNQYVTCSGKMEQVVHDKSLILPVQLLGINILYAFNNAKR